jgi:hypothetical protein
MCNFGSLTSPFLFHAFSLHDSAHRFSLEGVLLRLRRGLHIPHKLHLGHLGEKALPQLDTLRHVLALLLVVRLLMGFDERRRLLSTLNELLLGHAWKRVI